MAKPEHAWGAVPVRAAADRRLSGADFRVLVVIARHAGFGKNGAGCYATHATIAEQTGMARPTVTSSINDLLEFGYLLTQCQTGRKRKQFFVQYEEVSANGDLTGREMVSDPLHTGGEDVSDRIHKEIPLRGTPRDPAEAAALERADERDSAVKLRQSDFVVTAADGAVNFMGTVCRLRRAARERPLRDEEVAWLEGQFEDHIEPEECNPIEEAIRENEFRWLYDESAE